MASPLFAEEIAAPLSGAKNSYTIENTSYKIGYAENYGIPVWEMHILKPDMLVGQANVNEDWQVDSRVKGYRISAKDIANIKFEAVQLFPKTHAMNDTTEQESSFFTSNIVFMYKQLKESLWDRTTKEFEDIAKKVGKVYVYAGPIFEKDVLKIKYINNNRIALPTRFYRLILYPEGEKFVYKCYCFQNRIPTDYERICELEEYACNLYQLEADTNIDFFDREIDSNFRQDKMKYLETRVK